MADPGTMVARMMPATTTAGSRRSSARSGSTLDLEQVLRSGAPAVLRLLPSSAAGLSRATSSDADRDGCVWPVAAAGRPGGDARAPVLGRDALERGEADPRRAGRPPAARALGPQHRCYRACSPTHRASSSRTRRRFLVASPRSSRARSRTRGPTTRCAGAWACSSRSRGSPRPSSAPRRSTCCCPRS